jgi:hypothetical protein
LRVAVYHDEARAALDAAVGEGKHATADALVALIESLATRSG